MGPSSLSPLVSAVLALPAVDSPTPSTCSCKDCDAPAKYQPVLELYAVTRRGGSVTRWSKPATATLDLALCEAHAKTATADDFLTDEGWATVTAKFAGSGLMPPSRHLTKLKLAEIIVDNTKG